MGMEMKQTQKLNSSDFTEFRHLWTIFKLGELILQGGKNPRLGRLEKTKSWQDQMGKYLALYILYTDYDDNHAGRASLKELIYEKTQLPVPAAITGLSWYPLKFYKGDVDTLMQRLRFRGERFLNIKERMVVLYDGSFEYLKEPPITWYSCNAESFTGLWLPRTVSVSLVTKIYPVVIY